MSVSVPLLLFVATTTTAVWSLFARRSSLGCRWEGAPTLAVVAAALWAYLTSPYAEGLGVVLHRWTGIWNYEDFLGHVVAVFWGATAVYMVLARFLGSQPEKMQAYMTQWVARPVIVALALMQGLWSLSAAGEMRAARFEDMGDDGVWLAGGPWYVAYWMVRLTIMGYLLVLATKLVCRLRSLHTARVLNLYLVAFSMTIVSLLLMGFHVVGPLDLKDVSRSVAYLGVMLWALTAAHSWQLKQSPRFQPDVAREDDSDADRVRRK